MWPIKNFEKYFMAHQYMPKIFYEPHKTLLPPSYIINVRSLIPNFDEFFTIKQLKKIKYKYRLATHVEIINLLKS